MSWDPEARYEPTEPVRARRIGDEMILLHLEQGRYYTLNEVGAELWESVGRGEALGEALERLLERYEVDVGVLRGDLGRVLAELVDNGLLRARREE